MKSIQIAFALTFGSFLLLTTGCGKSKALLAAEEYEKSACACANAACLTDVSKKFAENAKDMSTASSGEAEAISKATTNAATCITKISMAGLPGMPTKK
jgi:hypothetical protein